MKKSFFSSGITLNMDEEQELTSLNWLLTSNVMPSGIETVPIEAPSSSLPANASSPALAPTKSKRPCTFFFNFSSFSVFWDSLLVFELPIFFQHLWHRHMHLNQGPRTLTLQTSHHHHPNPRLLPLTIVQKSLRKAIHKVQTMLPIKRNFLWVQFRKKMVFPFN